MKQFYAMVGICAVMVLSACNQTEPLQQPSSAISSVQAGQHHVTSSTNTAQHSSLEETSVAPPVPEKLPQNELFSSQTEDVPADYSSSNTVVQSSSIVESSSAAPSEQAVSSLDELRLEESSDASLTNDTLQDISSSEESSQAALSQGVILSTNAPLLGEVVTVRILSAAEQPVSAVSSLPFQLQFFPSSSDKIALLPISYNWQPGVYDLTVTVGERQYRQTLNVQDRTFEVQHLTIDESVAGSTNTAAANAQWQQLIEPLKPISAPEQYWDGLFAYPVPDGQKITTEFGLTRYTNGSKTPSRHSGIDIAAPTGTDIIAPNDGVVQFAGELTLTGYTIVMEHGFGLKSFYYHMNSVSVQAGDVVKKGQKIGEVGSTGYSTGPHLHFAMAVNNVFVNPWTAFERAY